MIPPNNGLASTARPLLRPDSAPCKRPCSGAGGRPDWRRCETTPTPHRPVFEPLPRGTSRAQGSDGSPRLATPGLDPQLPPDRPGTPGPPRPRRLGVVARPDGGFGDGPDAHRPDAGRDGPAVQGGLAESAGRR